MKSLRAALTALDKGDTPEVKETAPAAKSKPKKKPVERAPRGQRKDQITKLIADEPGIKAAEIAKKADMHASAVHPVLTKLVDDKEVVKGSDKGYSISTGIAAEMESNAKSETV